MKKTHFFIFIFLLLACPRAYSQTDVKAQTILFGGYQKYKTFKNVKIDFAYKSENKEMNLDQQYTGSGYIQGLRQRISYPDFEVLTDGTNIWTHYKKNKNVSITTYNPNDGMLTPEEIFREDFLHSGLTYKYISDNANEAPAAGKQADIIEFIPKEGKRNYQKFRIWINKETSLMDKWVIWLKNGTVTSYTVSITPDVKLEPKFFDFDTSKLPKDTKVIDRRKK